MSKKISLVGCGQLGSRHLQAVASLFNVGEVHVWDPVEASLDLGKRRLTEIPDKNPNIRFYWHKKFDPAMEGSDLCIVATQARGRCALVRELMSTMKCTKFLIEKVVDQSLIEYRKLIQESQGRRAQVWVNCKSRAYSIHQHIRARLRSNEAIRFHIMGGNHGLANNGVHAIDLFVFHDGAKKLYSMGSRIDEVLHPSKRGEGLFDLTGSLCGYSDQGSHFALAFSKDHVSPDHMSIASASCRFIVDHFQQFAWESYAAEDWKWKVFPLKELWTVSHMTKVFVDDLLNQGTCLLPTLEDCYPAHEFILNELAPVFNRLLGRDRQECPVT